MKLFRSVLLTATVAIAPLALAQNSVKEASPIETIAKRLTGTFDSNLQNLLEAGSEDPHQRLHFEHTGFSSVTKQPGLNIYVEQTVAASGYLYRQRVYNITMKNGLPTLEIYKINNPERFVGSHLDSSLLDNLKTSDLTHISGCDLTFADETEEGLIEGTTNKTTCIVESRGRTLFVTTLLNITRKSFNIYDEAFDSEGNAVWYREDRTGHEMARARIFDCWSVLRKGEAKDSGWIISKNNRVHDQGGKFSVGEGEKAIDITLSQLVYGSTGQKPVMKLGLHKKDVKPTFTYIWTNPEAENVGINLGHTQAGCTLVK
ncbi:chromophore lyase CpcT/CpeT [bacterium]|nr:chromophore lyase CpcT/CpeT [bacterium]